MDGDSLAHYDGKKTSELSLPSETLRALGGIGDEVFVAAESSSEDNDSAADAGAPTPYKIHHRHGMAGSWAAEPVSATVEMRELWSGGSSLWGRATDDDGDDHLFLRTGNGRWTERKAIGGATATGARKIDIRTMWISPTNDAFVAAGGGIYRSNGGADAWTQIGTPAGVSLIWGRSSRDLYVNASNGVLHYDGKAWTETSFTQRAVALGGTATDVLIGTTSSAAVSSDDSDD